MGEDTSVLFKTNDMSLAAYLCLHKEPVQCEWNHRTNSCYWFFTDGDGLDELVTAYSGGQARVDPKEYSYHYAQLKKSMNALRDGQWDGSFPIANAAG